jgi:hypothetical protein
VTEARVPLPDSAKFYIRPHPAAPFFSAGRADTQRIVEQLMRAVTSRSLGTNKETVDLLAQLGLCSLFFFLKFIAGYSISPYNLLNEELHLDMCNFRQSDFCMADGARAAGFLPRGYYKSTIFSHGPDAWEGLRNPNIAVNIRNAIVDNAADFLRNIRSVFDSNPLVEALYPAHYVKSPKSQARWNESELVLPNRTMRQVEATFSVGGMTGAGEGKHFDLLNVDDPIGLDDLSVENAGNMQMLGKMRWCKTNFRALLRSTMKSRICLVETRFSVDDTSTIPLGSLKQVFGFALEEFEPVPDGQWTVYNRVPEEDGRIIFPEVMSKAELSRALEEDQWAASTQLFNRPQKAGMAEFAEMTPRKARLVFDEKNGEHYVRLGGFENFDDFSARVYLKDMDIVMAVDPAGTEPGISAKACRTAIVIAGADNAGRVIFLKVRADRWSISTWFDEIFKMHVDPHFKGAIRETAVESNAMQKILKPLLDKEKLSRKIYVNFQAVPSAGDKIARIRSGLGTLAQSGNLYVCEDSYLTVFGEWKFFPQLKFKMDVLDAMEKAVSRLRRPMTSEEVEDAEEQEERFVWNRSAATGY